MTEYRPRIGDTVEIYMDLNGTPLPKDQRVRGRVTGKGAGVREGRIRVTFSVAGSTTSGWYRPEQLREV